MNFKIKLLTAALAALMLFSACGRDDAESSSPSGPAPATSSATSDPASSGTTPSTSDASTPEGTTSEASSAAPVVDHYAGLTTAQEKLEKAKTLNADTKAWITIPGTTVDAPVLQASNNEYYLKLDEYKNYSIFGAYYFDYENNLSSRANLSKNTIIYGHSDLKDNAAGPRFSQLFKYLDESFLEENSDIHVSIDGDDMVFQIFSVFYTHVNFNYIQTNPVDSDYQAILEGANQRNEYITDVSVTTGDKILTLSTCSALYHPNDTTNYRLVVMGKLLPAGTTDATTSASANPNPLKS